MIIIGIDPGLYGAIAFLDTRGKGILRIEDMPLIEVKKKNRTEKMVSLRLLLCACPINETVWLEEPSAMPGQGVSSTFKFGRLVGQIEGILAANGNVTNLVSPRVWKEAMGLGRDKDLSRAMATQLWPDRAEEFKRKKDDGRAEACLLAEYGRRRMIKEGVLNV
jgi:crossover junction endodeoxyribonuclease RuvC